MEKYGVDEGEGEDDGDGAASAKLAAERTKKCPRCGGELRPREVTGVILCNTCGSAPFEVSNLADAKLKSHK